MCVLSIYKAALSRKLIRRTAITHTVPHQAIIQTGTRQPAPYNEKFSHNTLQTQVAVQVITWMEYNEVHTLGKAYVMCIVVFDTLLLSFVCNYGRTINA